MAIDPITSIVEVGKTILNKVWRDKASEIDITKMSNEFELELRREASNESSNFRQFVLDYEGAAKDSPKIIQLLRVIIRPCFTILVGYLDFIFFTAATTDWSDEKISLLKAVNLIVLFFWFGERAVNNSGIVEILKAKILK